MITTDVPAPGSTRDHGSLSSVPMTGETTESPGDRQRALVTASLDWAERLLVLGLYGWLVVRLVAGWWVSGNPVSLLLLLSEGLVVFFMLVRRRAKDVSFRPGDWLLAVGGTCAPLLVMPGDTDPVVPLATGATLLLAGMLVQLYAKVTLSRSFGLVPAHRGVKVIGPYRLIRHPMYAGYLVSNVGFLLINPSFWNLAVYTIGFGLQVFRLLAEERLLGRDPCYRDYQAAVPYRLIPGVF
jgi:protein-S-isoprenylcysteine O-methyltransferase Ste14